MISLRASSEVAQPPDIDRSALTFVLPAKCVKCRIARGSFLAVLLQHNSWQSPELQAVDTKPMSVTLQCPDPTQGT